MKKKGKKILSVGMAALMLGNIPVVPETVQAAPDRVETVQRPLCAIT